MSPLVAHALLLIITAASILLMLLRPRNLPEVFWVGSGALLLIALGLVPLPLAAHAVAKGTDVYLFLAGMMLLSETARDNGVFDWLAAVALSHARNSPRRLFFLLYLAGVAVTVCLSNDATAIVLTPAVLAAVRRARVDPLPFLFACALVANAASFVLPISNPANLVVFHAAMPPLGHWLLSFLLPSILSILITYLTLRWYFARSLSTPIDSAVNSHDPSALVQGQAVILSDPPSPRAENNSVILSEARSAQSKDPATAQPTHTSRPFSTTTSPEPATNLLTPNARLVLYGLAFVVLTLLITSALGHDLGLPTFLASLAIALLATIRSRSSLLTLVKEISWSTLALVAALFVMVEAVDSIGALSLTRRALLDVQHLAPAAAALVTGFVVAIANNLINNLPLGLIAANTLAGTHVRGLLADVILIAVDLGPNLSVTGSLATILWLLSLRREGLNVTARGFLKVGVLAMPAALLAALAASIVLHALHLAH